MFSFLLFYLRRRDAGCYLRGERLAWYDDKGQLVELKVRQHALSDATARCSAYSPHACSRVVSPAVCGELLRSCEGDATSRRVCLGQTSDRQLRCPSRCRCHAPARVRVSTHMAVTVSYTMHSYFTDCTAPGATCCGSASPGSEIMNLQIAAACRHISTSTPISFYISLTAVLSDSSFHFISAAAATLCTYQYAPCSALHPT